MSSCGAVNVTEAFSNILSPLKYYFPCLFMGTRSGDVQIFKSEHKFTTLVITYQWEGTCVRIWAPRIKPFDNTLIHVTCPLDIFDSDDENKKFQRVTFKKLVARKCKLAIKEDLVIRNINFVIFQVFKISFGVFLCMAVFNSPFQKTVRLVKFSQQSAYGKMLKILYNYVQ